MTEPENNLPWIAEQGGLPFTINDNSPGSPVDLDNDLLEHQLDKLARQYHAQQTANDNDLSLHRMEEWFASDAHGQWRKIHDEGVVAFQQGVPRDNNPYDGKGGSNYGAWDHGWKREFNKTKQS